MADIDQIIAGGAGAGTTADFSGIPKILDYFYKGRDEAAKNDLRTAFSSANGGLPLGPDGQPDWSAVAKTFIEKGGSDEGIKAAQLGLIQNKLRYGQDVDAQISGGSAPQQPIISPATSRNSVSIDPSKRADQSPQPAQQPQQPNTVMQILAPLVPNDQLGAASASVARQLGVDPTQPINMQDPQVRNVLVPALQRIKQMGLGQVQPPQPGDQPQPVAQQQPAPQPQPAMQQQPAPQPVVQQQPQQPTGPDPRFVGLVPPGRTPEQQVRLLSNAIASGNLPPEQAKLYQGSIDAIRKAAEPTQAEKDFQAAQRNPKLDDYTASAEAAKASAKGVAEADVKEQNDTIAAGHAAQSRLSTLNTISNIISSDKNMTLGFGADTALKVKMALKQIGIDTGDLSGPQAIQKLNAQLASESTKAISPRPAQFEFKTFLGNNPGLSLDKQGNERVIGIFSQLAKRDVDLGKLARQNRDNWSNWDTVVENYDKKFPIKDPTTGRPITTNSIVAPGPAKSTAAPALEPGKTVVNGHTYIGGPPNSKTSWELRS